MARIQGRVARGFNWRHRYFGRLWQSRYKARVVDTNEYFRQVTAYVHLNPVSAGLVTDPASFEHSGHGALIGHRKTVLVDVEASLRGFSESGTFNVENYLNWIRSVAEASWLLYGIDQLPWWIEAEHVDEIAVPDRHQQARTFDGRDPPEFASHLEFREFTRRYERVSGHFLDDLRSSRRNPDLLRGRIELVTLAVGRCGYQSRDVALLFAKNPGSVTRWLRLGICRQREDPKFKKRLISLEKEITQWGSE